MTPKQSPQPKFTAALFCPDCGEPMDLIWTRTRKMYRCSRYPACRVTHAAHPDGVPVGTPADAETRKLRMQAHAEFDKLWQGPKATMLRDQAYSWMGFVMGLTREQAHIGKMDADQCRTLIAKVQKEIGK